MTGLAPIPAHELQVSDEVGTAALPARITSIRRWLESTSVLEVHLDNIEESFYAGMQQDGASREGFIEVFGELPPMQPDEQVKILTFSSYDQLDRVFEADDQLQTCCNELERHGFSSRLATRDSGLGRMFVRHNVAHSLIWELRQRNMKLSAKQVIVSREFELVLLGALKRKFGGRLRGATWLKSGGTQILEELQWRDDASLELKQGSSRLQVKRTFLHITTMCPTQQNRALSC